MKYLVSGEALIDFLPTGTPSEFKAINGGSCYNVALGLGRLGQSVGFFGGFSQDMFGEQLTKGLKVEGVSSQHFLHKNLSTTTAFVSLDETGTPSYAFYGTGAADRSLTEAEIPTLDSSTEFLHFGSLALVTDPTASTLLAMAKKYADAFICFDPNIRPTVEPDMAIWREKIEAFVKLAKAVKVSREDLDLVYGDKSTDDIAADWLSKGAALVCVTDGGDGAYAFTQSAKSKHEGVKVKVVDTVGAGDTFSAALLYHLGQKPDAKDFLAHASEADLHALLDFCCKAAAITCSRKGADLPRLTEI